MPKASNHVGVRFGKLVVLSFAGFTKHRKTTWNCRCDCGKSCLAVGGDLTSGHKRSCGCLHVEALIERSLVHGDAGRASRSPEYRSWATMINRCTNPNGKQWPDYGGRGITVCARWRKSFSNFLADMGRRPSPKHSIDRRDNDRGYSPKNCRWATPHEQRTNQRRGTTMSDATVAELRARRADGESLVRLAAEFGISKSYAFKICHVERWSVR